MAELGVHGKFQARLKPNAVPSTPLTVNREVKDGRPIQLPMPRAFEKRRKAEVSKFMNEVPSLAVMCPHFSEITVFRE
jgi:F420-0:gamma-glutamyl ligase-like protein